ncbi:hypothetical protein OG226_21645 [Streptomyces sp. NBC_01261]|nr:hypothetical protein [Streptomyces sp. NBC_01261]
MGAGGLTLDLRVDGDGRTRPFRMRGEGDKGALDMTVAELMKDARG